MHLIHPVFSTGLVYHLAKSVIAIYSCEYKNPYAQWAFPGNIDTPPRKTENINLDGYYTKNLLFPDGSVLRAK
jgi:hypothetical protein